MFGIVLCIYAVVAIGFSLWYFIPVYEEFLTESDTVEKFWTVFVYLLVCVCSPLLHLAILAIVLFFKLEVLFEKKKTRHKPRSK
jgi:hypothetical protein